MTNISLTSPGRKENLYLPLILFIITIITRIPFTSEFLYHSDSVHFTLALEEYNIKTHQPHPPGYFLYVMLGRLLNLFISDPNTLFISISIFFSGLTIVAIYYLTKEMFDTKTALIASAISITSPNIWFHGEVALTYIIEAFFSTVIAFFCWKIYKGDSPKEDLTKYLYLSAIILAIAGGIRQNTTVFLLPLWLFSIKRMPIKNIILSFIILGVVCLSWFIPMVQMTGGYDIYKEAFRELWLFNTGTVSVFHKGWAAFKKFSSILYNFIVYSLGIGAVCILFAFYLLIKHKKIYLLNKSKSLFFFVLVNAIFHVSSINFYT
jgi:4-amino-4-deoxy-L-arabinose transferase-like glycosyltransferase